MLCEKCKKNNATTHIKTVINGKVSEQHLCEECARAEGIAEKFEYINPLSDMLTSIFGDTASLGAQTHNKRCGCCNSSLSDIMNRGKLGCSECYETFYEELLPYFNRIHGDTKHIGKIAYTPVEKTEEAPASKEEEKAEDTVEQLKKQLKQLIEQENFEQAAFIRDKIKSLEEKD